MTQCNKWKQLLPRRVCTHSANNGEFSIFSRSPALLRFLCGRGVITWVLRELPWIKRPPSSSPSNGNSSAFRHHQNIRVLPSPDERPRPRPPVIFSPRNELSGVRARNKPWARHHPVNLRNFHGESARGRVPRRRSLEMALTILSVQLCASLGLPGQRSQMTV